jgi:hypothetical protein
MVGDVRRGGGAWPAATITLLAAFVPIRAYGQAPIQLVPVVASGLSAPVFVTTANDGSGRLFIVEQAGRIRV